MTEDRYISLKELKSFIIEEELNPSDLFTEEQLKEDPELKKEVENLIEERRREEEEKEDFIPGDDEPTDGDGDDNDDEFIPD